MVKVLYVRIKSDLELSEFQLGPKEDVVAFGRC